MHQTNILKLVFLCACFDDLRCALHLIVRGMSLPSTAEAMVGWDSIVSVATHYRLHGLGIKSPDGEIFRSFPDRPCDAPSPLYSVGRGHPIVFKVQ
jgi:hypothetical protein